MDSNRPLLVIILHGCVGCRVLWLGPQSLVQLPSSAVIHLYLYPDCRLPSGKGVIHVHISISSPLQYPLWTFTVKEGGRTLSALILFIFSILLNFWDNLLLITEISEVLFLYFGPNYSVGQWWSNQWYSIELYIVNPTLGWWYRYCSILMPYSL